MSESKNTTIERPPVVTIMGHIDHGKSTLLDYIRKTNIVDGEAGGITQHLSAYEVVHTGKDGVDHRITFLDTPGHEAFGAIRARGAKVADIGILVVSAEDGVKPQTLDALRALQKDNIPYIVAINKIDKPGASIDRTKQNLAENDIFVEGYGGDIPWAAISAKTGEGIPDLLDLILLSAEILEQTGDTSLLGTGIIIESNLDTKKGLTATAIVKNGTIQKGQFVVCGGSISPLRILEDFRGKPIDHATFSSPIRIIGWDTPPSAGETFICARDKKEATKLVEAFTLKQEAAKSHTKKDSTEKAIIPLILKADTSGSLDALVYEIGKLENERVIPKVVLSGLGPISENDIRVATGHEKPIVIGFHTKVDSQAEAMALRLGITIEKFDIIYKITEWLEGALKDRTPTIETEETTGQAKILKFFSKTKDKQIIGGRVEQGEIVVGEQVKIIRRDTEVGRGRLRELQTQKEKTSRIGEGKEFGAMLESKVEVAPGDKIECFALVQK